MKTEEQLYLLNLKLIQKLESILEELHCWFLDVYSNHEIPKEWELEELKSPDKD